MSYYTVKPPRRSRLNPRVLALGVGVLVVLPLLAGWAAARPFWVTVDGHRHLVASGATVGSLAEREAFASPAGQLLSVEGEVLDEDGGYPPTVARNGRPSQPEQSLYAGDVIVSSPGSDRREPTVVVEEPLPYDTRYEGSGPMVEMTTLGAPGIRRVTRGEVSGIEVTSTVVSAPADLVVRRFRGDGKVVALTFDDGPWPVYTDRILEVLEDEGVHATFFMLGRQAERYPKLARRVAKEGHGVAAHSFSHRLFTGLTPGQVRWEIRRGREAVEKATGQKTVWLRPPYGAMNSRAWGEVRDLNGRAVLWDVDSKDWTKPGAKRIERSVLAHVKPGSVVLFHDGGGNRAQTATALRGVIRRLKARGYRFVTVEELYELRAEARKDLKSETSETGDAGPPRSEG